MDARQKLNLRDSQERSTSRKTADVSSAYLSNEAGSDSGPASDPVSIAVTSVKTSVQQQPLVGVQGLRRALLSCAKFRQNVTSKGPRQWLQRPYRCKHIPSLLPPAILRCTDLGMVHSHSDKVAYLPEWRYEGSEDASKSSPESLIPI